MNLLTNNLYPLRRVRSIEEPDTTKDWTIKVIIKNAKTPAINNDSMNSLANSLVNKPKKSLFF